jgi:hypothetical protein
LWFAQPQGERRKGEAKAGIPSGLQAFECLTFIWQELDLLRNQRPFYGKEHTVKQKHSLSRKFDSVKDC